MRKLSGRGTPGPVVAVSEAAAWNEYGFVTERKVAGYALAEGSRQRWNGCWGRKTPVGSVSPGIRSTGTEAHSLVSSMSRSRTGKRGGDVSAPCDQVRVWLDYAVCIFTRWRLRLFKDSVQDVGLDAVFCDEERKYFAHFWVGRWRSFLPGCVLTCPFTFVAAASSGRVAAHEFPATITLLASVSA